jgi:hypothetical protein
MSKTVMDMGGLQVTDERPAQGGRGLHSHVACSWGVGSAFPGKWQSAPLPSREHLGAGPTLKEQCCPCAPAARAATGHLRGQQGGAACRTAHTDSCLGGLIGNVCPEHSKPLVALKLHGAIPGKTETLWLACMCVDCPAPVSALLSTGALGQLP